jgi:hypothetical protein
MDVIACIKNIRMHSEECQVATCLIFGNACIENWALHVCNLLTNISINIIVNNSLANSVSVTLTEECGPLKHNFGKSTAYLKTKISSLDE